MNKSLLKKIALIGVGAVAGHLFGSKAIDAMESIKK